MESRENNIFVAFALWAASWNIVSGISYLFLELQFTDFSSQILSAPVNLGAIPVLPQLVMVLLISRLWKKHIVSLVMAFAAFDLALEVFAYATATSMYLLCSGGFCSQPFTHEFGYLDLAQGFAGYALAAVVVSLWRAKVASVSSADASLDVNAKSAFVFWKRWANLPLWKSGTFLANLVRPLAVPFFGLSAATVLATQAAALMAPLLYLLGNQGLGHGGLATGLPLIAFCLLLSLKTGKMLAEFGYRFSSVASFVALLLVNYLTVDILIIPFLLGNGQQALEAAYLFQSLAPMFVIYLGFVIGFRIQSRRSR